jgi:acetyl/propionyl-CoA carboxylase alpha subunit
MRYYVTIGPRTFEVDLSGGMPKVDGVPVHAELATVPGTPVRHLLADARSHAFIARPLGRRGLWELTTDGGVFEVEALDERTRAIRELTGAGSAAAEKTVKAPMPGLVMRVEVEVGQAVKAGQGVVIVEAMKMENELKTAADGVVAEIRVRAGQAVEKGATLIVLE